MRGEQSKMSVCVIGGSGFIAFSLVKKLLEKEYYHVKATLRDLGDENKVNKLLELPNASTHLSLWKGDLVDEGSFDDAISGCNGVFHVATPTGFLYAADPENAVTKATVNGIRNIMSSCAKAKSVKKLVYTSTIGTICIQPQAPLELDESFWTDIELCRSQNVTGWAHLVAKIKAEKAAWEFSEETNIDFVTVHPSLVFGPFFNPPGPASFDISMALITKNELLYPMLRQAHGVHLDDVCNAHIYLFEHPQAKGRYICSSHSFTIFDLAKSLQQKYPHYNIPTEFDGVNGTLVKAIPCSSKKLMALGFKFKYNPEEHQVGDLLSDSIELFERKLVPTSSTNPANPLEGK